MTIIRKGEGLQALENFIAGKRSQLTSWCDWDIPLHIGGMSDPFQPCEEEYRYTYDCLELLAETQYPFVISTKGSLICAPEYLELLSRCNCVVQISMACDKYDKIEQGAPPFNERLNMVEQLAAKVKRVNIRVQPYMTEIYKDLLANIPLFAKAGAYGIIIEGMKFAKKKPGMVKVGGDHCYPLSVLKMQFNSIKTKAHENNMRFYSAENRLRMMSDDITCCGIDDLADFKPNLYNAINLANGIKAEPTDAMSKPGSALCFKAIHQDSLHHGLLKNTSFVGYTKELLTSKREYADLIFGIKQ